MYALSAMDERELANTVVEIVDRAAYRNAVRHIACVHIAIGGLRHFDLQALEASFATVARGTVAEGRGWRSGCSR